jgi:transposase InsO family protein
MTIPDTLIAGLLVLSLPPSYNTIQLILTHQTPLSLDSTIATIVAEESRRRETGEQALKARTVPNGKSSGKSSKPRKQCSNPKCKRTGHTIEQCWQPGEGQEGKGPKDRAKNEERDAKSKETQKESVKAARMVDNDENEYDRFAFVAREEVAMSTSEATGVSTTTWCVDSGCTIHITPHKSYFLSYQPLTAPREIRVGNKDTMSAIGIGTVPIIIPQSGSNTKTVLHSVLHIPNADGNLLSLGKLSDAGYKWVGEKDSISIWRPDGTKFANAPRQRGSYYLRTRIATSDYVYSSIVTNSEENDEKRATAYALAACRIRTSKADQDTWHRRLAHLDTERIVEMERQGIVDGMEIEKTTATSPKGVTCETCVKGKQHRDTIPKETNTRATEVLGRVFSDICDVGHKSREGHRYYATFTDDYLRYTYVVFLKHKDDVIQQTQRIIARMETETGMKLKAFQTDGGKEYLSDTLKDWLEQKGVVQEVTNAYTPQEDGVSERKNRTLNDKARASIHETAAHYINHRFEPLPRNLWNHDSDMRAGSKTVPHPVHYHPTQLHMRNTSDESRMSR